MAKKKLGYVELHWECPNCSTINPGGEKVCKGCAAPQPEDVEFFQASQQQLIQDEERLKKAKAGADIHCAYCGARNPAGAASCSQCKADLSEGTQRKAGQVVGAYKAGAVQQVACPNCGAQNPETTSRCSQCGGSLSKTPEPQYTAPAKPAAKPKRGALAVLGLVLLAFCVGIYFIFLRTDSATGTVTGVEWERSVVIEGLVPVEYEDWFDEIPADGEVVSCTEEKRDETDQPIEGAVEICGTPYSVDTGSGYAEVVQDCIYEIYEDYCTYTLLDWAEVDVVSVTGQDANVYWPDPFLAIDERTGEVEESYTILFDVDGERYTHVTGDYDLFKQATIGSTWNLEINSIDGVQSISQ